MGAADIISFKFKLKNVSNLLLAGIIHYKHPMKRIIEYFCHRHVLVNLITAFVLIGGVVALDRMAREELPDITFNTVRISTNYAGASAQDIEYFITQPIEDALDGMDGIQKIQSTSSRGQSSITVELDVRDSEINAVVDDIKNQVASVDLPPDIKKKPTVQVFETSKKAIIDLAIYDSSTPMLSLQARANLQAMSRALKKQLVLQKDIHNVRERGYLNETLTVQVDPKKLLTYGIDLTQISSEIKKHHVRSPAGQLNTPTLEQINVNVELDTPEKLNALVIQGGFDSVPIRLEQLAQIRQTFNESSSITKVNGHEAIVLNIVKNKSTGILTSLATVKKIVTQFQDHALKDTPYAIAFMDDESIDLRNRLAIVGANGLVGIGLIFILLMLFLNKRAGFWVALGIPFSLSLTLIVTYFMGYSINVITLSAIIIVLGIVVDDAIIVAENISKKIRLGLPLKSAAIVGTSEVLPPILASILTTCIAFLPLLFFDGRFGSFVQFLAPVIFLMLGASLIESFFILPSHMCLGPPPKTTSQAWFDRFEGLYQAILTKLLPHRHLILIGFLALLAGSIFLGASKLKFVLFPNVESREIVISGTIPSAKTKEETAIKLQPFEFFLNGYIGKEGLNTQTTIAEGRRGQFSQANQFRITMEITPKNKRKKSIDALIDEIKAFVSNDNAIQNVAFRKRRWGQSSGSIFDIVVQDNNDSNRASILTELETSLASIDDIENIERDEVIASDSFDIGYDQTELKRLGVSPTKIAQTMRTILSGERLFTLLRNDEEVDVLLSVRPDYQTNMERVLSIPISNQHGYMVPLNLLVKATITKTKQSIRRQSSIRTSYLFAERQRDSTKTPLEIATHIEQTIFPSILSRYPSAQLRFEGEVIDTQSSKQQLLMNLIMVIGLIYGVLAILFNSFTKPMRVIILIPFGVIGVILAFYFHQKTQIGFYACVGTIGMIGVVINDGIVLLDRLDTLNPSKSIEKIPEISTSRLRAIVLTTLTTVIGVFPTAYGLLGYDPMLSDMMLALAWGLVFGTFITLVLVPCIVAIEYDLRKKLRHLRLTKKLGTLLLLLLLPTNALASTTLTLKHFITRALNEDTAFHKIIKSSVQQAFTNELTVDYNDLILDLSWNRSINEPKDHLTIGLSEVIPEWGQRFDAEYSNHAKTTTFKFSQDISKNAFGQAQRLDHQLQTMTHRIVQYQLIEAYEDYYSELAKLYYEWVKQYKSISFAQSAVDENRKALTSVLNRQKKKIADDTDVAKLKLQVLAKQETLLRLTQTCHETTLKILRAIGSSDASIIPDTSFEPAPLTTSKESVIDAFKNSRTHRLMEQIKQKAKHNLNRAMLDALPSVSFTSQIQYSEEKITTLGLSFQQAAKNNQISAKKKTAALAIDIQADEQASFESKLLVRIQNLYSHLGYLNERIKIAEEKMALAELIFSNESTNYALGKINLNDFIVAVNRRDNSSFDLLELRIAYQQQTIELRRLTDQLVLHFPEP